MKKNSPIILLSLLTLFATSLSACSKGNNENSEPQESSQNNAPAFNVDFSLNEIEEEFDIHTEEQNNYLNDTYDNIDKYGSGSSEKSKPKSLDLSWKISNSEKELTALRLDLYEKDHPENVVSYNLESGTTKLAVDNLKLGTDYEWSITAISGNEEVTSTSSLFSTKDGVARFINIDGLSNVRDCGGWLGLNGKKIKQGLLYRGEEFNKQNNGRSGSGETGVYDPSKVDPEDPYGKKISEKGINTVVNELKIKTEVDIRGYETFDWETRVNYAPTECGGLVGALPDGSIDEEKGVVGIIDEIDYVICPVHTNRDKIYYDSYGHTACKNFFSMLADKETRLPLYFHCAQGKDRTGFLAYLFEALLGCAKEDMLRDYLLSNLSKTGSVSISKVTSNYNYVDYFDGKEVSAGSNKYQAVGDSIAERAYNYLLECGLTNTQLDTIRETFLEE